jgi:hypothetical protein
MVYSWSCYSLSSLILNRAVAIQIAVTFERVMNLTIRKVRSSELEVLRLKLINYRTSLVLFATKRERRDEMDFSLIFFYKVV